MNQTISFITLGVADLARSRAFYQALGWQESSASQETIAFFQAGSVAFALFQREALAEDAAVLFCRPRWLPVGSLFQPFCGARCRGFR